GQVREALTKFVERLFLTDKVKFFAKRDQCSRDVVELFDQSEQLHAPQVRSGSVRANCAPNVARAFQTAYECVVSDSKLQVSRSPLGGPGPRPECVGQIRQLPTTG